MPCSIAVKTRNPLKFAGVPQTNETISAASGPKFIILWGMWRRYCCLIFFPIVDTCLSYEDIARQSCTMVPRWRLLASFLRPVFSASRVQHISDLYSKFALGPHHVWKYGIDTQSAAAEIRRGKMKERKKPQGKNIWR